MTDEREIPLTQGRVALVDAEDYPTLSQYRWHFHVNYYAARSTKNAAGKFIHRYMHLDIMGVDRGVDHIDNDGLNNKKSNLRVASWNTQSYNRRMPYRDLPRGVRVHYGKYVATIQFQGKKINGGRFDDLEDAVKAYQALCLQIYGELPPPYRR